MRSLGSPLGRNPGKSRGRTAPCIVYFVAMCAAPRSWRSCLSCLAYLPIRATRTTSAFRRGGGTSVWLLRGCPCLSLSAHTEVAASWFPRPRLTQPRFPFALSLPLGLGPVAHQWPQASHFASHLASAASSASSCGVGAGATSASTSSFRLRLMSCMNSSKST